jgi:hypothetical protein
MSGLRKRFSARRERWSRPHPVPNLSDLGLSVVEVTFLEQRLVANGLSPNWAPIKISNDREPRQNNPFTIILISGANQNH